MKNFRTFELAVNFYKQASCLKLPSIIKNQLDRAALSIPLNLAEGRGKPTRKDQVKFFNIAMGSLRECEAILIIVDLKGSEIWKQLDILGAHLYKLIKNS